MTGVERTKPSTFPQAKRLNKNMISVITQMSGSFYAPSLAASCSVDKERGNDERVQVGLVWELWSESRGVGRLVTKRAYYFAHSLAL